MTPLEALYNAISAGYLYLRRRKYDKPGDIVSSLPAETREALSKLSANDMEYCWADVDESESARSHRLLSEEKIRFDKFLKGGKL